MRNNLFKAFLSAVAGSAVFLVALFVMNIVRPETAVVEASPAVAAPSLAATDLTTVTMTSKPDMLAYSEVISSWIVRSDQGTLGIPMTATVKVNGEWLKNAANQPVVWNLPANVVTSEFKLADNWYPGSYYVTATVYMSGTVLGYVPNNNGKPIKVIPMITFDSAVPSTVNLGAWFTPTVKIQPAVNYISNTNEVVEYDLGDGKQPSVKIDATSSYIKSSQPGATYVYTGSIYTKGATYTIKATYKSGIYGEPMATVTKTINVKNPTLTVKATPNSVKVNEPVQLDGTTDFAVDTASVEFSVPGKGPITVPMTGTNATTIITFTQAGDYSITGTLKAFGNDITTSAPVSVTVQGEAPTVADKVVASAAKTLQAGDTTPVSATVTGGGKPIAGQVVSFTIQAGSSQLKSVTATTNDQGVAKVELTGALAAGKKYETTIVHANLPGTSVAPSPVNILVYAKDAEVPDVVDGATVVESIAGTTDTVVNTKVPAGANQVTFQVTVKAGTTITLPNGTSVSLAGGKIVVTPIVSPTNEAALKTTSGGDITLFGVIINVYYIDEKGNPVNAGSGVVFNPAISVTATFGKAPATLTPDNLKLYYLDDATSTWKSDGITVTDVKATSVTFNVSHLTQFGGTVASGPPAVYLPFIMRAPASTY